VGERRRCTPPLRVEGTCFRRGVQSERRSGRVVSTARARCPLRSRTGVSAKVSNALASSGPRPLRRPTSRTSTRMPAPRRSRLARASAVSAPSRADAYPSGTISRSIASTSRVPCPMRSVLASVPDDTRQASGGRFFLVVCRARARSSFSVARFGTNARLPRSRRTRVAAAQSPIRTTPGVAAFSSKALATGRRDGYFRIDRMIVPRGVQQHSCHSQLVRSWRPSAAKPRPNACCEQWGSTHL
jgi:hypothetical protein